MKNSLARFLWLSPILAISLGCNRVQNSTDSGPFVAQAANASTPADAEFSARMAKLDQSGDYGTMVAAARARLGGAPSDTSAQYALALGSFYNGDFALAVTEWEKLTAAAPYQQDAEALEFLRVARFLAGKYASQKFQPVQVADGDVTLQSQKWRAQGAALIAAKKYDEIERIAAAQTQNPTVMSDGSWTLASFYVGLWDGEKDSKSDVEWRIKHAQIAAWSAARPNSQLARTCLARSWTNGAWTARGEEFANQVSSDAWKTVEERQKKAAPIYRKLLSEKVTSPLVYGAAQRFGRLGSAPREWQDQIFRRAIAQFPDYTDFYRERAIYLLPRWDGAPGEWEKDLETSANAEAARTGTAAGDRLYARVVWGQWDYYTNMRNQTQIDWPRTKRGFDSILQQNPDALSAATIYMRLCYQWGESTKARELLQIVGGRADSEIWGTPHRFARSRINILRLLP